MSEARANVLRHLEQGQADEAVSLCRETIITIQSTATKLFSSATEQAELLLSLQILLITSLYALGDNAGGIAVCEQILSVNPKHFRATLKKAEGQCKMVSTT